MKLIRFPHSLAATLRSFTFYVGNPIPPLKLRRREAPSPLPRGFAFYAGTPFAPFLASYWLLFRNLALGRWTLSVGRLLLDSTVKPSFTSIVLEELEDLLRDCGAPSYRAKQITDWIYKKRVASFDTMTDLPNELRAELAAEFDTPKMEVVRVLGSKDTTQKFLFRLHDQNLIESVLIPASPALYGQPSDRRTICVSTQVGCAYGCKFCASGLEGFSRNLDAAEIVQQLIEIEKISGEKIDNVVFMGMGEPLANLRNVLRAIRIINAPWGLGIGARHITVSTSGLAPQIRELANESKQFRLAISLHGATDQVRGQIMPVNKRYPLRVLLEACDDYVSKKRRLTFEYILIGGINDTDEQARELAKIARRLSAKINLIPYNTVEGLDWSRSPRAQQEKFQSILRSQGVIATLRREKGHDIAAACGQLRLHTKRAERDPVIDPETATKTAKRLIRKNAAVFKRLS